MDGDNMVLNQEIRSRPLVRQTFTPEEDAKLHLLVMKYGQNWKQISSEMANRSVRQCRERYQNYLAPGVLNGPWTPQEDQILYEKYQIFGRKWTIIAKFFKNRSGANIKNRWSHLEDNFKRQSIPKVNSEPSPPSPTIPAPDSPVAENHQQTLLPPINELSNKSTEGGGIQLLNLNLLWNNRPLDPLLNEATAADQRSNNSMDKFRNFKGFAGKIW
ncbi:Myb-like DNA-binding domain containing protein [Trichomonas vaginalis G3]|uniref:Myb-like DNA-binding domain containing protein n=1 Tax=Trichomonas vaginalis (strain ATCC PRA-98 / G3) TaxID=412133 RepID=A2EGK3_TRIV3|nr:RNA polymerase II transcription regulator recruiting protein [Trichomonas vaginalis G3]EAY08198.1 Myb-like DNA-binding domain containing protein [Trichomonas vaginalis G3]KAI5519759.1 RNA polymerase II transcription regulator recruiting protein [Trichomonas vaginalis G3]|eukprot:XP_001320421.1 Myb-like DNA-binding domain containing protein [Trichomonas vaginalis G3]